MWSIIHVQVRFEEHHQFQVKQQENYYNKNNQDLALMSSESQNWDGFKGQVQVEWYSIIKQW
jgi:hypothetical protein